MQLPLQITFRNMQPSAAVEAKVRERAENLDKFYEHIMSCQVVIEPPHKHHHRGNLYQVRLTTYQFASNPEITAFQPISYTGKSST